MGVLDTKHGFLVTLEKTEGGYSGRVAEHEQDFAIGFSVDAEGAVVVLPGDCPADLADRARLVVRASLKQNAALDLPPPRRITRWRPAK